jgi:hypothetical protein
MLQIAERNSYKSSGTPKSGVGSKNWGKNPIGPNGVFAINNPKNDNWTGWGSGYDDTDDVHFVESRSAFLNSKYAKVQDIDITNEHFNQLANDELLTFVDNNSLTKHDTFEFTSIDGNKYKLDNSKESQHALAELIRNTYYKASDGVSPLLSKRQINKSSYYDAFTKNNPELVKEVGYEGAEAYFTKIYNKNVKFDSSLLSKALVSEIFGKLSDEKKTKLDKPKNDGAYSANTFIEDVESQESRSATIANDIKDLNNAEMQKLYETLIQRKYQGAGAGGGGAGLNKDETELLKQLEEQLAKEASLSSPGS